jgi:NADH:ubiquinone oxidoreductase subunit C
MEKKEIEKKLLSYQSLKERAEKLLEESKKWEVRDDLKNKLKKLKIPQTNLGQLEKIIKIASKSKLTQKNKRQLIRIARKRLLILLHHFSSIYNLVKQNPNLLLDKKISVSEENLKERLSLYERIIPILFKKKE